MMEEKLDHLFAIARRAGTEEASSLPFGFAEAVLRLHQSRVQENKAFFRTSILSIATAAWQRGCEISHPRSSHPYVESTPSRWGRSRHGEIVALARMGLN